MPIRINLLAETQAAEEARRRDPVKRAIWMSAVIIVAALLWWGFESWLTRTARTQLQRQEQEWKLKEAGYKKLQDQETRSAQLQANLDALTRLSTNRFLWGSTLNAFQQTTVDQVQFIRLSGIQTYSKREDPAKTVNGKKIPGDVYAVEKIAIFVEAKDYGSLAEENYKKLRTKIAELPFFKTNLVSADAIKLSRLNTQPMVDAEGKTYTSFILECQYPERVRGEK
jgi:hypothetical protein